ncbi:MAG TPA: hypothetical protein ENK06_05305 [Gammaproteobacteria bacterium]|nr:hypothetical protein [Gammaproteobacteria bacterium]
MKTIPKLLALTLILCGCASTFTEKFSNNLSSAILNNDDPETVRLGVPAYMIMLDSILLDDPDDPALLQTSASLHNAYASLFSKNTTQAINLANKARRLARQALCEQISAFCEKRALSLAELKMLLKQVDKDDIKFLYTYGATLASWIKIYKSDWNTAAQVPQVQAIMERVVELDETYEWGRAHLFLGIIHSQLPAALGGKPEKGLTHFNKAIEISGGKDLIAKIELARNYARLVFEQALHDRVLNEVVAANAYVDNLTLSNILAKRAAQELLATSKDYFEE